MGCLPRPINADRVRLAVLLMIVRHAGRPCPTREEIIECTGLPKRKAWDFLRDMQDAGMIDIEEAGEDEGRRRRMRVKFGPWTEWTQRRPPKEKLHADAAGVFDDGF